ncbi:FtsW/RodA/SpoVE family cell cycle protein [Paenibacillus agricola]|uniref:FtsW/RodA/SpoVE family cell cycle protein n=1 Tax=Paenibacillus agricola TaxID=2716264 RepID=A0ABX0J8Y7_9BACL|nr:FtsW/RodA/SpoVE family cell cycle protein [Paenibacillus agricola]NHN30225.1 FtsW/RodA/SpoVE family cell cycle protein [Paenibacillus agricola]
MSRFRHHEQVRQFLNEVCKPVQAKAAHRDIKLELESHLADKIDEYLAAGVEQAVAIDKAILDMGSAVDIGNQLHKVHKPRIEWSLLGFIALFVALGMLAMYAVELADPNRTNGTFLSKVVYSGIGVCVMLALRLWDYRKLLPFSWHFYRLTLLVMGWVLLFGQQVNGAPFLRIGSTTINFLSASPYLLIVFLAGIMMSKWKQQHFLVKLAMYVVIPFLLYQKGHANASMFIYTAGFVVLLFSIRKGNKQFLGYGLASFVVLNLLDVWSSPHKIERLRSFLNPYSDPMDSGYTIVQSLEAIQAGGWWGQGFAVSRQALPGIQNEMLFSYMIYSLGWVTGIVLWFISLLFLIRLAGTARRVKEPYGKLIVKGLLAVFAIQFVWSMLMPLGILPFFSLSLPFISHGGTLTLIQMAAVGIILGVYRQKDIARFPENLEIS